MRPLVPRTEAQVEEAFARRPGTLIVIAHRISSALRARRILVLDSAEMWLGTHDDLLRRSALYRDLVGRWEVGSVAPADADDGDQGPPPRRGVREYLSRWTALGGLARRRS